MKSHIEVMAQRILLLVKMDGASLFARVKERKNEYLGIFAIKRTRKHFDDIFFNRYRDVTIKELVHCPEECLVAIDQFYNAVEKMQWYLNGTEDMPATVEDKINRKIKEIETLFYTMGLYIDAELNPQLAEEVVTEEPTFQLSEEDNDHFVQD